MNWREKMKAAAAKGDAEAKRALRVQDSRNERRVAKLEADHREKIFSDYGASKELRARLATAPIDKLRVLLETYTAPPATTPAQPSVTHGPTNVSGHGPAMDRIMGTGYDNPVVDNRNTRSIRLMTPSQAREHVKRLDARAEK